MQDMIIFLVLAVIIGSAARYVYQSKKHGVKCIGCPSGGTCSGGRDGSCGGCDYSAK